MGKADRSTLRAERLSGLRATWEHARQHSSYYARVLPALKEADVSLERLADAPVMTRTSFLENRRHLRCGRGLPSYMVFTGGSTGLPLVIYGAERDLEQRQRPAPRDGGLVPLALATDGGHHGFVPQVPGRLGFMQVPLRNRKNYEWAWHVLTTRHDFEGHEPAITSAVLPLPAAKKLTYFALENELDTSQLALKRVTTFAWHLSAPWRQLIQRVLRTRVRDSYGFTEIPGALAQECRRCGWYHYGREVVWEAVDPESNRAVDSGVAKLLVTSLVPYVSDTVSFRYEPDDLIELGPHCSEADERGFKLVGRRKRSLSIEHEGSRHWLLLPSRVQEIIDLDPWVARLADTRFCGITASEDDSFPKWNARLEHEDKPTVVVNVEMKFDPKLFQERFQGFALELRQRLMDAHPSMRQLSELGVARLRVQGLPPGALANDDVVVC